MRSRGFPYETAYISPEDRVMRGDGPAAESWTQVEGISPAAVVELVAAKITPQQWFRYWGDRGVLVFNPFSWEGKYCGCPPAGCKCLWGDDHCDCIGYFIGDVLTVPHRDSVSPTRN